MADKVFLPFEVFAEYYDEFMEKLVDYPSWVNYVVKIWQKEKVPVARVLDLACGTGIPTLILLKQGYEVTGLDISNSMLSVLRKKVSGEGLGKNLRIREGDMRDFQFAEKFDAVVSFYDSINYLTEETDLRRTFASVFSSLSAGGLFTFDINTIFCLEEVWDNHSLWRESENLLTHWQNEYDKEKQISTLHLRCWVKGSSGGLSFFEERHEERGYELEVFERYLREVGFSEVNFYHHLTFRKPSFDTTRVMVVAKKGGENDSL